MVKPFPPSPEYKAFGYEAMAWWDGRFSDQDLREIQIKANRLSAQKATIGGGAEVEDYRRSTVKWMDTDDWFGDDMGWVARQLNGQYYGFDLWGFGEKFQHTEYEAPKKAGNMGLAFDDTGGHYKWHIDVGLGEMCRKLSLVLMLNTDYEGGELQVKIGDDHVTAEKVEGRIYAFPSYHLHRVTPVTKGIRRTVVSWVSGPKFR